MWKAYISGYIKNNRSAGLSVGLSAFISALLLSLLCGLFYNAWKYEVERIVLEEGGWQSRLIGTFAPEDIEMVSHFAHVKDIVIKDLDGKVTQKEAGAHILDIYFDAYAAVFSDTPRMADLTGTAPQDIVYNYELLSMYFIRDANDTAPRLVFPLFILITVLAAFSLIVIIQNAFAVSMNARIHQFGIFASIGATPKQIRICLLQEAAALCAVPVIAGSLFGIVGSMVIVQLTNRLSDGIDGRHQSAFGYHPLVLILTLFVILMTIFISAFMPARKLSRLIPLEAIKNAGELQLMRKKNSPILTLLFGVEGELAGNALKAQKKALRTASFSLILSCLAFTLMQCFFTLSGISTRETYFQRYQDAWDIMVTVKDTEGDTFQGTNAVQNLAGVKSAVVYQKAKAKRIVTEDEISEAMKSFGGFSHASSEFVSKTDAGYLVNAPLIILDDNSFVAYCEQIGITPQLDGAVIRNQICDVTNPDFRHPVYMPYIKIPPSGKEAVSVLRQAENPARTAEIPVLSYTREVPVLREEYASYDPYELVHFIPVSLWKEIKEPMGGLENNLYIRILAEQPVTLEKLQNLQEEIKALMAPDYTVTCENRIQEYETNDKQLKGMLAIFSGFCVLLALIGMGSIFSNTLGFVRQRKREFARYMSVGLTPAKIRKMFCIEALVITGRPILITLPLSILSVWYMLKISYVNLEEFLKEAPYIPVALFMLMIISFVALAYYMAWHNIRKISLAELLKDDTML